MPTPSKSDLAPGLSDPRQAAFDSLKSLLAFAQVERDNINASPAVHQTASQLCEAINEQMDALTRAVLSDDSAELQASAVDLESGVKELKVLQARIAAVSEGFKHAAEIISGIDEFISKIRGLGLIPV